MLKGGISPDHRRPDFAKPTSSERWSSYVRYSATFKRHLFIFFHPILPLQVTTFVREFKDSGFIVIPEFHNYTSLRFPQWVRLEAEIKTSKYILWARTARHGSEANILIPKILTLQTTDLSVQFGQKWREIFFHEKAKHLTSIFSLHKNSCSLPWSHWTLSLRRRLDDKNLSTWIHKNLSSLIHKIFQGETPF